MQNNLKEVYAVFVPWLAPSLNKIWAGCPWRERQRMAQAGHAITAAALPHRTVINHPVRLEAYPIIAKGQRRYDCTNYILTVKVVEDALVRLNILPGDSPDYVTSVTLYAPQRGKENGIWIRLIKETTD